MKCNNEKKYRDQKAVFVQTSDCKKMLRTVSTACCVQHN